MSTLPITPLETALLTAFPDYALDSLRTRFLYAVTSDHAPEASARAVVQMAYETELRAPLRRMRDIAPGIADERVPTRLRFLEISDAMASFAFLFAPALTALASLAILPESYIRFLQSYLDAPSPRYRMCAVAALLCFTAIHFGDLA